jgi:hypothetical protein
MTAFPCRIRHSPGLAEPELSFDVSYVMDRVAEIRRFKWTEKWSKYVAGEWNGQGIPYPINLDHLVFSYRALYPNVVENLRRFESENFTLPSFSRGVEQVRQTVCQ